MPLPRKHLVGSLAATGSLSRSSGLFAAVSKHLRLINLKAAKRITITYDPFHANSKAVREVAFQLSTPKLVDTNPLCMTKTVIDCARRDPFVEIDLIPAVHDTAGFNKIKVNARNLTALEIYQLLNKHLTVLAPKEENIIAHKTKSDKKRKHKK